MINFLEIFKHLLPHGKAWQITTNKQLRNFFEGLSFFPKDVVNFLDLIFLDIFPETTRQLDLWEEQFGLFSNNNLSDQDRRNRLDAYWKDAGGQSLQYIQNRLQKSGFDVYLHEWWEPGAQASVNVKACAIPRNPLLYLSDSGDSRYSIQCGEILAQCGEPLAQTGQIIGNLGYALVNKIYVSSLAQVQSGETLMQCGEISAQCGGIGYYQTLKEYIIPNDSSTWPYFLYIGGEAFGDIATIEPSRKDEFERLCLKICPAQQWLGIMVQYQ